MRASRGYGVTFLALWLLLGFFSPRPAVRAQTAVTAWEQLLLELWPDYDRSDILVLITGSLPAGTPLPASVTVPIPPEASLNAVARLNAVDGLIDDIAYDRSGGMLTLTTPDPAFRVEYYLPYEIAADRRTIAFGFSPVVPVGIAQLRVQEPAHATEFAITPAATVIVEEGGLRYHALAERPLAAGETLAVEAGYSLPGGTLTAGTAPPAAPVAVPPQPESSGLTTWLPIIGLALAVGVAAAWGVGRWQARGRRPARPRPRRQAPKQAAHVRFCRHCGAPVEPGDHFCRACGGEL